MNRYEIMLPRRMLEWLAWQPEKGLFKLDPEYWVALKERITWCQWIATDPLFRSGDWT